MADTADPAVGGAFDEGAEAAAPVAPAPGPGPSPGPRAEGPEAAPTSARKAVGAVTKVSPSKNGAKASKRGEVPAAWGPGNWNRFNRDLPPSRPRVSLTKTSKSEMTKRHQWEHEKRAIREREERAHQAKVAAAQAQKAAEEQEKKAQRRLALEERVRKQREKTSQAAEERLRREVEYQRLLERTREKGLLHERLQQTGDRFVEAIDQEKLNEYQDGSQARRINAKDIQSREELHPAFKQVQRRQMAVNQEREAQKPAPFLTSRTSNAGSRMGSGFSQFGSGMARPLPGSGIGTSVALYAASPKPKQHKQAKRKSVRMVSVVERGTSPLHIPGVEILIHGKPYVAASAAGQSSPLQEDDLGEVQPDDVRPGNSSGMAASPEGSAPTVVKPTSPARAAPVEAGSVSNPDAPQEAASSAAPQDEAARKAALPDAPQQTAGDQSTAETNADARAENAGGPQPAPEAAAEGDGETAADTASAPVNTEAAKESEIPAE